MALRHLVLIVRIIAMCIRECLFIRSSHGNRIDNIRDIDPPRLELPRANDPLDDAHPLIRLLTSQTSSSLNSLTTISANSME